MNVMENLSVNAMNKNQCSVLVLALIVIKLLFLSLILAPNVAYARDVEGSSKTGYQVSSTGAFNYSMDIQMPPGVNGMQPDLGLHFSSRHKNGPFGVGWQLSGLSSITRCGRTHATDGIKGGVNHDANDRYCLNGQRLIPVAGQISTNPAANGTYVPHRAEYRTELESFSKIISYGWRPNKNGYGAPTHWRVWKKDGTMMEFGTSEGAQFVLPGTTSIHSWKLSRHYDRNSNYYEVTYQASEGLPLRIYFTRNNLYNPVQNSLIGTDVVEDSSLLTKEIVRFYYEIREDKRWQYVAGTRITKQRRINQITVFSRGGIYRTYTFDYHHSPISKNTRMGSIRECGRNGKCFPAIKVDFGEHGFHVNKAEQ